MRGRSVREGLRDPELANRVDKFLDETGIDNKDDLLKALEILSEKLHRLESARDAELTKKIPLKSLANDEVDCSFIESCYAAKSKTGNCPCELRR